MYCCEADWKPLVRTSVLLGVFGTALTLAGLLWRLPAAGLGGSALLSFALYLYIHRTWEQGDFISLAETYLLVSRRKKAYIFHANDIKEVVYGNSIGLKYAEQWFTLNYFVPCKQFQNELVKFAVRNGIYVHAAGCVSPGHGKYARLRVVKR